METQLGAFTFSSNFDSGNLARVIISTTGGQGDDNFNGWTTPDCAGTAFQNGNRTWFNFSVTGGQPNRSMQMQLVNLNKQSRLYSHGHVPMVRYGSQGPWQRLCDRVWFALEGEDFRLFFLYKFPANHNPQTPVFFAFSFPYSYSECQALLDSLDARFALPAAGTLSKYVWVSSATLSTPVARVATELDAVLSVAEAQRSHQACGTAEISTQSVDAISTTLVDDDQSSEASDGSDHDDDDSECIADAVPYRSNISNSSHAPQLFSAVVDQSSPQAQGDEPILPNQEQHTMSPPFEKAPDLPSPTTSSGSDNQDAIYYHRDLLVKSLEGRRVDILTISSHHHILEYHEPTLPGLYPEAPPHVQRARQFDKCKPIFFLSSRVHPGETPASHVFNGFLQFILKVDDPRAAELRRRFVFKLVPILNPDGVVHGHYRTDTRGQNLNRFYLTPDPTIHPTIFAVKSLLTDLGQRELLSYYVDLHGHASKKGCFMYGNALEEARQADNIMFPKLVALNSAHFDFDHCDFAEKNMFAKDKRDGLSKEGSGRVAVLLATNVTHCYTLECNYNMGRVVNRLAPLSNLHPSIAAESVYAPGTLPQYTVEMFEEVGRGLALALADMHGVNPISRLGQTEYGSLANLRRAMVSLVRTKIGYGTRAAAMIASRRLANAQQGLANARKVALAASVPVPQAATSVPLAARALKSQSQVVSKSTVRPLLEARRADTAAKVVDKSVSSHPTQVPVPLEKGPVRRATMPVKGTPLSFPAQETSTALRLPIVSHPVTSSIRRPVSAHPASMPRVPVASHASPRSPKLLSRAVAVAVSGSRPSANMSSLASKLLPSSTHLLDKRK